MRLWHWKLIPYLPNQQLLGQWRECNLIARNLSERGTPNHVLVNRVVEYPVEEFLGYCKAVANEMEKRGFKADILKLREKLCGPVLFWNMKVTPDTPFFKGWHNDRYLIQCYYNLQEKYDSGGIPFESWMKLQMFMNSTGLIPQDIMG